MPPLKIALIVADEREARRLHHLPQPYFGSAPSALIAGFQQMPEVELHIVCCVRQTVSVPEKLAANTFFHVVRVPQWGFLRTGYLPCILGLRRKLHEIQPDIVHGQGTEGYYGIAAAYSGFPNVITIHGNMRQVARSLGAKPFSFYWLTAHLEAWAIRRADGIVCLTRYTRQQVEDLARKTWVLPNAVDEAYFRIKPAPTAEAEVLCVAAVICYKNQIELIRCLDSVAVSHRFRLVFIGGINPEDPYCTEFLRLVEERPWCIHKGFVAGKELHGSFASAQLLVLPSLEDNCPMVILEAQAAGVPVAASRIGGIPDLIEHGVNGLLFDPTDSAQIRAAVTELLTDADTRQRIAMEARKRALKEYHPVEIGRRHLEIYADVLRRPPPRLSGPRDGG